MHTLHYVAVKIDEDTVLDNPIGVVKEEAATSVKFTLQGDTQPYASWYDWFVVGGGRFVEGDAYSDSHDNCIAYHDEPEQFIEKMNSAIQSRKNEAENLLKQLDDKSFDFIAEMRDSILKDNTERWGTEKWNAYTLTKMALGYWSPDSYFFDITSGVTTPEYLLKDIEENKGLGWVLVPVDFHF